MRVCVCNCDNDIVIAIYSIIISYNNYYNYRWDALCQVKTKKT